MLYCGERIGDGRCVCSSDRGYDGPESELTHPCIGSLPSIDIAVDPLDGTSACATGKPGAVAVIALAERGALFNPGPAFYMNKLAVGPAAAAVIDIRCVQTAEPHVQQV